MWKQDSRDKLNDLLFDNFIGNSEYNNDMQNISLELKNKIKPDRIAKLFNGQIDIMFMKDLEVYFLDKYFYKELKTKLSHKEEKKEKEEIKHLEKLINEVVPENFFTQIEIDDYESSKDIDDTIQTTNRIIIKDCVQVMPNMWCCPKIPVQELTNMEDSSQLTYNKLTQRETEKRNVKGNKIVERIKIYKKSVKEIKKSMLEGSYFPTALAFNILANGYEKFEYNEKEKELIIEVDEKSEVDLVDGMHRMTAAIEALRVNPDLEQYMSVNIFHLDILSARRFVLQESKKNDIAKELLSYYDTDNVVSKLVYDIDMEGTTNTNFIKNHIGTDLDSVHLQNKYCTYDTLIKAISDNFKINKKDLREIRKIKEYLINFFNEVISLFNGDFDNVKNSRIHSYRTVNNSFYGYIAIASKLYKVDNWQDELCEILYDIDFDKTNDTWKGKGITSEKLTGKQMSILYSFFLANIKNKEEEVMIDG